MDYGKLILDINEILAEQGISKNRICKDLDIPRSNFNKYCRGDFQRIDAAFLCKLCWYLKIDISELVKYIPPEDMKS